MQWAAGEILQLVKDLGKEENTMSMFISDHGGQKELCLHGGNNGHLYGLLHSPFYYIFIFTTRREKMQTICWFE